MEAADKMLRLVPKTVEVRDTVMLPLTLEANHSQADQTSSSQENASQDIARLAYVLWEQLERPEGSAEQDWNRAEELLTSHNVRTAAAQQSAEQIWSEAEDQTRKYRIRTANVAE